MVESLNAVLVGPSRHRSRPWTEGDRLDDIVEPDALDARIETVVEEENRGITGMVPHYDYENTVHGYGIISFRAASDDEWPAREC